MQCFDVTSHTNSCGQVLSLAWYSNSWNSWLRGQKGHSVSVFVYWCDVRCHLYGMSQGMWQTLIRSLRYTAYQYSRQNDTRQRQNVLILLMRFPILPVRPIIGNGDISFPSSIVPISPCTAAQRKTKIPEKIPTNIIPPSPEQNSTATWQNSINASSMLLSRNWNMKS